MMLITIRRGAAVVAALALVASVLALAPRAAAGEAVYEAEGTIIGGNPAATTTRASFVFLCDIPPNQGGDAYVFALPPEFGDGSGQIQTVGSNPIGLYDLDLYFYDAACATTGGTLATDVVDEAGPIPAGTTWVVVHNWVGVNTSVALKATRAAGDPLFHVGLTPDDVRVKRGQSTKLSGTVKGCTASNVKIYSDSARGFLPVKTVEVKEGKYELKVSPQINTTYVAEVAEAGDCKATRSKRRAVKVEAKIKIDQKRRCRSVAGRVLPNQSGSAIKLQRKVRKGEWSTVDQDRLSRSSRFVLDFPQCGGDYRVVWSRKGSHLARTARTL